MRDSRPLRADEQDGVVVTTEPVHETYSRRAAEYIAAVGTIEHASQVDRDYLLTWAKGIRGRVVDVGSGPGQWTDFFHHAGIEVQGVDPSEVFIERARSNYPDAHYTRGRAERLDYAEASVGGILAWFSLIHHDPAKIGEPLAEFARCLAPGGSVALGFFDGPAREAFDHAITTAYYWSVPALTSLLNDAGFDVTDARTRQDPGVRRQGVIVATLRAQGTR